MGRGAFDASLILASIWRGDKNWLPSLVAGFDHNFPEVPATPPYPNTPSVVLEMAAMDATTSDPPPELSLIEQFGAWLDAFPAVPAWLQWVGVGLTIGAPTITFLWVRWGANWWAARSRNAAEKRARKLVKRVAEMHALSKNRPAMLVDGLNVIIALVLTSLVVLGGLVQLGNVFGPSNLGQPPSDFMISGRFALVMFLHAVATCIMVVFCFCFRAFSRWPTLIATPRSRGPR